MITKEDLTRRIVDRVKAGETTFVPFRIEKDRAAYYINGRKCIANAITLGPEYSPEIELLPNGWIKAKAFFMPMMVPEEAWLDEPNEHGVVPVHVEIDPAMIDFELYLDRVGG